MVRAPKWIAAIFQKRIEDAKVPAKKPKLMMKQDEEDLEEFWSSLIHKNPDFAMIATKTIRKDYHLWLEQHKTWTFVPKTEDKQNDLVFIVGPHGEMRGAVKCAKV